MKLRNKKWVETKMLKTKFQDEEFDIGESVEAQIRIAWFYKKIVVVAEARKGGIHTFAYDTVSSFLDDWEGYGGGE